MRGEEVEEVTKARGEVEEEGLPHIATAAVCTEQCVHFSIASDALIPIHIVSDSMITILGQIGSVLSLILL